MTDKEVKKLLIYNLKQKLQVKNLPKIEDVEIVRNLNGFYIFKMTEPVSYEVNGSEFLEDMFCLSTKDIWEWYDNNFFLVHNFHPAIYRFCDFYKDYIYPGTPYFDLLLLPADMQEQIQVDAGLLFARSSLKRDFYESMKKKWKKEWKKIKRRLKNSNIIFQPGTYHNILDQIKTIDFKEE